jgi:hypothetical protein
MKTYTSRWECQQEIAMNFKKATDELLASVTLADLADAIGVSVQAIRQARAADGTTAHRAPPEGWEVGVSRLAKKLAKRQERLAGKLGLDE